MDLNKRENLSLAANNAYEVLQAVSASNLICTGSSEGRPWKPWISHCFPWIISTRFRVFLCQAKWTVNR